MAALVLVGLTLAIFGRGLRGPAVTATVIDDAVVGWLAGLVGPGVAPFLRGVARSTRNGCPNHQRAPPCASRQDRTSDALSRSSIQ